MKKTYLYNLLFLSTFILTSTSCKKPLDVAPVDTVEQSKALVTSKDVEATLTGAYADLGSRNFYGGRVFLMADFLANTNAVIWSGTYQELTQTINRAIQTSNLFVDYVWRDGYKTINDANTVLANIDKVTSDKKTGVEGTARFIRGAVYFDLVRVFGKAYNDGSPATNLGVPIVLTPTGLITEANSLPRATVAAVYQQAIADLTAAQAALPVAAKYTVTRFTAAAMLARIYLQMGDYTNARAAADLVIASGTYSLTESFAKAFPTMSEAGDPSQAGVNNTEDILAMQVTNLTGFNGFNEFYGSSSFGGRGDAAIDPDWIAATYEDGDARKDAFYEDGDLYTIKYGNLYGNVPVIRLAEMYLIRAEANVRLGSAVGQSPLADLAVIRSRSGLTTSSATLADVLMERKRELAFEGFALHDAKRTATNIGNVAWNANSLVFPIPQRELDTNKKLVQNAGYN